MKYENSDLDFIFIRAKNKQDKWDSLSLREVGNLEFRKWLFNRHGISVERVDDDYLEFSSKFDLKNPAMKDKLTPCDRLSIINWLAEQGVVFAMIKKEARNKIE